VGVGDGHRWSDTILRRYVNAKVATYDAAVDAGA